ncbi:hypothetical protein C6A77_17055 [Pseudomonas sp. AFG_SD02_1510_Pfu_092]|nr:hypothetical protein C6A77_17055 [Pseudomonas sp. AFG_SD02_1510_Pfu_092]
MLQALGHGRGDAAEGQDGLFHRATSLQGGWAVVASSRVNPLPQGLHWPEGSAVPVGAGLPAKRPTMVSNLPLSAPAMQQLFNWRSAPDGFSGLPRAPRGSLAANCAGTRPRS